METFQIPTYEYYENEGTYISPEEVDETTIDRIKSRRIGAKILGLWFSTKKKPRHEASFLWRILPRCSPHPNAHHRYIVLSFYALLTPLAYKPQFRRWQLATLMLILN